jgi:hypothetical protein
MWVPANATSVDNDWASAHNQAPRNKTTNAVPTTMRTGKLDWDTGLSGTFREFISRSIPVKKASEHRVVT